MKKICVTNWSGLTCNSRLVPNVQQTSEEVLEQQNKNQKKKIMIYCMYVLKKSSTTNSTFKQHTVSSSPNKWQTKHTYLAGLNQNKEEKPCKY